MGQPFFEELSTLMYPSGLLHAFGVNGKISGSIGAVGEMQGVLPIIHGARGCGFHYRHSARRRHQPLYRVLTSDLTEQEIILGGEEKLRETVRQAFETYRPGLIMIIPSPVSDILNEDIRSVAHGLRKEGIPVASVQSELFSHRDKNYSRSHLKALAGQKITGDNRLEMELKGCGFTEALCALVEQVMQPCPSIPRSVNIETVGWGCEGRQVLGEIGTFLEKCGITVNCWIPSSPCEKLAQAPAAQLNLVKRVRWARRMKERFGTDYLHLGGDGRYSGLDGICTFYRDIAVSLGMEEQMEPLIAEAQRAALEATSEARQQLAKHPCALVTRSIQSAPFQLKRYVQGYGIPVKHLCVLLTPEVRRNMAIDQETEEKLLARIREAAALCGAGTQIWLNPRKEELDRIFSAVDAVVGTGDATLEGRGAPLIPPVNETISFSFESYIRTVLRLNERMEHCRQKPDLLLNRMDFSSQHYPLHNSQNNLAAKELWARMWLERKEEL